MTDQPPPGFDYDAYVAAWYRRVLPVRHDYPAVDLAVMICCGCIGGSALIMFATECLVLLASVVVTSPTVDPHHALGLAVPSAIVTAVVLPGVAPPGLRAKAFGASAGIFVVVALLAITAVGVFG